MNTMRTPDQQAALDAFIGAAVEGEAFGYPERAAVIPANMEGADEALWRYLHDGRTAIIVDPSGVETVVAPARVSRAHRYLNDLRRRIAVEVYVRPERRATPTAVAVHADIGRRALGEVRDAVPV